MSGGVSIGPNGLPSYSNNYIRTVLENKEREAEYRRKYGYTDRDHVTIHTLPKGQRGKKYGSFSYKPMSSKAKRLQSDVCAIKRKIRDTEYADMPDKEKAHMLGRLRCQLKYTRCKLQGEIATMPRVGVIVLEEGE